MLKTGTTVVYRDLANRQRKGEIDRISLASGERLYRVDDRWFPREALALPT